MIRIKFQHKYYYIISLENLLEAWKEFMRGKRARKDVQEFERNLMANIISLHRDLEGKTYRHGNYNAFKINDPKPRDIHKASVRDRLVHHAVYRILYPYFDGRFIYDSYSCRLSKGTHRAMNHLRDFSRKVSKNNTRTCWVLKCDIKKFFASIDHIILKNILVKHIEDKNILWFLSQIIDSFNTEGKTDVGLPLGNLTSQLFVNIYMNEFDQFVKHRLKAKYYLRYADDFVVLSRNTEYLEKILPAMQEFLGSKLKLSMHPDKISIQTVASGVDFLGWVHFPDHRVLRTTTKKRMFRNIKIKEGKEDVVQSYLGLVSHGNSWKLRQKILKKKSAQSF
ncbi:MAG: reverse transcriptase/maturase family protein [Candidatus Azambacteria bacterium]|nr:reverse transcriptase/maturase family protein [Candidatus Azambacteria bacterium]